MEPVEKYYIEKNIDADDEKSIIKDGDLSIDIVPETSDKEDKSLKDELISNTLKTVNNVITGQGLNFDTNDMFLMLVEDTNNTLRLPNKRAKNLQLYIGNQLFQTGIKSDLESYLELKKRSEFFDEFIIDCNRFLNNYTIYAFPINRYSKRDK